MAFLIAIGGHVGTGKTTLAYALKNNSPELKYALVIEDDQVRRELLGADIKRILKDEDYSTDISAQVFKEIKARTMDALSGGISVINSSGFFTENLRKIVQITAVDAQAEFVGLWLVAPFEVMRSRISKRVKERNELSILRVEEGHASDADERVIEKYGDIGIPSSFGWNIVDANVAREKILLRSLEIIRSSQNN